MGKSLSKMPLRKLCSRVLWAPGRRDLQGQVGAADADELQRSEASETQGLLEFKALGNFGPLFLIQGRQKAAEE